MPYKLTTSAKEILKQFEGKNGLQIIDTSEKGFVLWFGMTKEDGVAIGFIEEVNWNPLHQLCNKNAYIPQDWIIKNLTSEEYEQFIFFMIGQWQSEYGIFSGDVRRFLILKWL